MIKTPISFPYSASCRFCSPPPLSPPYPNQSHQPTFYTKKKKLYVPLHLHLCCCARPHGFLQFPLLVAPPTPSIPMVFLVVCPWSWWWWSLVVLLGGVYQTKRDPTFSRVTFFKTRFLKVLKLVVVKI